MPIPVPIEPAASKPTAKPDWARADVANGPGGANNVIEPGEAKKDQGWDVGERPPREYMNWLQRFTSQWIDWSEEMIDYIFSQAQSMWDNWSIDFNMTSGLDIAINPGSVVLQNGEAVGFEGTTSIEVLTLADDSTNIIYWDGVLDALFATTTFVADDARLPIYRIVTASGEIDWDHANTSDLRSPNNLSLSTPFAGNGTSGVVPDPGSEDDNFLRDDGDWVKPRPTTTAALNVNYTLAQSDDWKIIPHTGAPAIDVEVPLNATVPITIGTMVFLVTTAGAGAINIVPESGSVVVSSNGDAGGGSPFIPALGSMGILTKTGTNTWNLMVVPLPPTAVETVYAGYVDAAGSAEQVPSGWSVAKNSVGNFTVTHNLGLAQGRNLSVVTAPIDNNTLLSCNINAQTANDFDVLIFDVNGAADPTTGWHFIAKRNV